MTGVVIGLFCAASPAGETLATVTVNVTLTILPYAEVQLPASVDFALPPGPASGVTVNVAGSVLCNCPVGVYVRMTPPAGAPGTWNAYPSVLSISAGGSHHLDPLLRIVVWDIPALFTGGTFNIKLTGATAAGVGEIKTPGAGEVIVTVVPD